MATQYQSIQSNTSTSTTCVVTKPTSLAVGDLMVAIGVNSRGASGQTVTLPSGFTSSQTLTAGPSQFTRGSWGWKIADSADVAASNFTFSVASTPDRFSCHLIRVSATSTSFGTPVISLDDAQDNNTTANPTFTVDVNTVTTNGLIIATFVRGEGTTGGVSGYTTSGTNPTWSERYDDSNSQLSVAIATATPSVAETFTSFDLDTSNSDDRNILSVLVVSELQNATPTISHIAVTPTLTAPTGSNSTTPTVSHLAITPILNGTETTDSSTGTQWTPINKA